MGHVTTAAAGDGGINIYCFCADTVALRGALEVGAAWGAGGLTHAVLGIWDSVADLGGSYHLDLVRMPAAAFWTSWC